VLVKDLVATLDVDASSVDVKLDVVIIASICQLSDKVYELIQTTEEHDAPSSVECIRLQKPDVPPGKQLVVELEASYMSVVVESLVLLNGLVDL
jgi:hypothetical protein